MGRCAQCQTLDPEAKDYPPYGVLCSTCAHRQNERDEFGYGFAPGTFGFLSDNE